MDLSIEPEALKAFMSQVFVTFIMFSLPTVGKKLHHSFVASRLHR